LQPRSEQQVPGVLKAGEIKSESRQGLKKPEKKVWLKEKECRTLPAPARGTQKGQQVLLPPCNKGTKSSSTGVNTLVLLRREKADRAYSLLNKNFKIILLKYCRREKSAYLCTPETKESVFRLFKKREKTMPHHQQQAGDC
jgi:hypothetical protein